MCPSCSWQLESDGGLLFAASHPVTSLGSLNSVMVRVFPHGNTKFYTAGFRPAALPPASENCFANTPWVRKTENSEI